MRIRRSAARLLGSAYSATAAPPPYVGAPSELRTTPLPPPPCYLEPCSAVESGVAVGLTSPGSASGEPCELSRSPWDLIAELSLSDPQVEDDLVDKYFVSVPSRASWVYTASMPVTSVKKEKQAVATVDGGRTTTVARARHEVPKNAPKKLAVSKEKKSEPKTKAKVKEQEEQEVKQPTYKCKKNDGKRWHCGRPVSSPNTLCDYHFLQKRAYLNPDVPALVAAEAEGDLEVPQPAPAASKPASRSRPRKKKSGHDLGATEGFYYYTGFGPCRSKRHCRSSNLEEYVPPKEKEEEPAEDCSPTNEQAQAAAAADTIQLAADRDGKPSCEVIAGVDDESSDDNCELGSSGHHMNGSGEHRFGNFDDMRSEGWKRRRKPVKERSLKSLM